MPWTVRVTGRPEMSVSQLNADDSALCFAADSPECTASHIWNAPLQIQNKGAQCFKPKKRGGGSSSWASQVVTRHISVLCWYYRHPATGSIQSINLQSMILNDPCGSPGNHCLLDYNSSSRDHQGTPSGMIGDNLRFLDILRKFPEIPNMPAQHSAHLLDFGSLFF